MLRNLMDTVAGVAGYIPKPTSAQEYAATAQAYFSSTGETLRQMLTPASPVVATQTPQMQLIHKNQEAIANFQVVFSELPNFPERWNSPASIAFIKEVLGKIREFSLAVSDAHGAIPPTCTDIESVSEVLCNHQKALTLCRDIWEESLIERQIFLKLLPEQAQLIAEIEKDATHRLLPENFKYAYTALCQPKLAAKLSNTVLFAMLTKFASKGVGSSAGKALHGLVSQEILQRIHHDTLDESDPQVELLRTFFKTRSNSNFEKDLEAVIINKQKQKAQAFKKIYQALCDVQKNINSSNFLHDKQALDAPNLLKKIEQAAASDANCTAAIAWMLTKKHFLNVHENNFELVNELIQIGTKRSTGLVRLLDRKLLLTPENFAAEKSNPKSQVAQICAKLSPSNQEKENGLRPT